MHLFHITECSIQNRNVHTCVLNRIFCDMERVHSGIFEIGLFSPCRWITLKDTAKSTNWLIINYEYYIKQMNNFDNSANPPLYQTLARGRPAAWLIDNSWQMQCTLTRNPHINSDLTHADQGFLETWPVPTWLVILTVHLVLMPRNGI